MPDTSAVDQCRFADRARGDPSLGLRSLDLYAHPVFGHDAATPIDDALGLHTPVINPQFGMDSCEHSVHVPGCGGNGTARA